MVTDEELSEMVKKLAETRKANPPMEERTDGELLKIAQEANEIRKSLRAEAGILLSKYWEIKDKMRQMESTRNHALTIKGERKGKHCPAKKMKKEETYYRGLECEARRGHQYFYNDHELYRKYCSTCKLLQKTIKKRLTFKRVFETRNKT